VTVSWKQPGDDWLCGSHSGEARYQVLVSSARIVHPSDGRVIAGAAASGGPGQTVTRAFTRAQIATARHLAVLYRDNVGNWGLLRDVAITGPAP
jgi:hypothetical protein